MQSSTRSHKFVTYKHIWLVNELYGNAVITDRRHYPLGWMGLLSSKFAIIARDKKITSDPSRVYEDESPFGQKFTEEGDLGIQPGRADQFWELMESHNIDLSGKSVLDVSGGNGIFLDRLRVLGAGRVVHTEFSSAAVSYSRDVVGIESHLLDINKQRISQVVSMEKFDIILLRGLIEFCKNLPELIEELEKLSHDGTKVIIGHCEPSLGAALRSQFDQYNMQVCRTSQSVIRDFESASFSLRISEPHPVQVKHFAFQRMTGYHFPFYVYYLSRALIASFRRKSIEDFYSLEWHYSLLVFDRYS